MSNGSEACCALGICCPPAKRKAALVKILMDDGLDYGSSTSAADSILSRFVLAPESFGAVVDDIMTHWHSHGKEGV